MKTNSIDKFIDFSIEAFDSDDTEFYSELGMSKQVYLDSKLKTIKRLKLKSMSDVNKSKNETLLNIAKQKIREIIDANNDFMKSELEKIMKEKAPQFQFRNLEKLENNDLIELINDIGVVNIIEDLDKLKDAE